jgi:hypothetical protein
MGMFIRTGRLGFMGKGWDISRVPEREPTFSVPIAMILTIQNLNH